MIPLPTDPLWLSLAGADASPLETVAMGEVSACRAVVEALPPRRFARGLHVGCGAGLLTRYLASECDTLLAVDDDARALRQAELRCEDQPWVQFATVTFREEWPEGGFQLIVLDDLAPRLRTSDRRLIAARALTALAPGGTILLRTRRRDAHEERWADRLVADYRPRLVVTKQVLSEHSRIDVLN